MLHISRLFISLFAYFSVHLAFNSPSKILSHNHETYYTATYNRIQAVNSRPGKNLEIYISFKYLNITQPQ